MSKKLVLIDGHSILNRAFFGLPDLTNSEGVHTNAVYGFLNILFKIIEEERPDYLTIAFDVHAPTFRHKMYEAYKGTRGPMDDSLRQQVPLMKEMLSAMGVRILEMEGYEADDVLGTLSVMGEQAGFEVSVVSGDRDLLQLATDHVKIRIPKTKKTGTEIEDYYADDVRARYQVSPRAFIDVKALMGDTSDNIPGVPGIGEKTATALIAKYGSIEEVHGHASEVRPPRASKNIVEFWDQAVMSKELATIITDVPLEYDFAEAAISGAQALYTEEAYLLCKRLEFKNLLPRFQTDVPESDVCAHFRIVRSRSEAEEVWEKADHKPLSFYFAEGEKGAPFAALAVTFSEEDSYLMPVGPELTCGYLTERLLSEEDRLLIAPELKQALKYLPFGESDAKAMGWERYEKQRGRFFDRTVAAYLLNPLTGSYPYEDVAKNYLGLMVPSRADLLGKQTIAQALAGAEGEKEALAAACYETWTAFKSWPVLKEQLENTGMLQLFSEVEMPLVFVLSDMERAGICLNTEELKRYGGELSVSIAALAQKIYDQAGEEFNINSPKQLGVILFEKLGLPNGKKTKTGFSTSAEVLDRLAPEYPIVSDILEYRQLSKLKSTYADGLVNDVEADGRIHTTFNQTITATGRLSSTEPNLQNIPIRIELGKLIRKVFYPKEGCLFIDSDYSQIELRLLAHMSGDKNLLQAFAENQDIHRSTASLVFHTPFDEVTDLQRRSAKAVNFGIVYGISAFGLAQDLGIGRTEAQSYIDRYFETYPSIHAFLEKTVMDAKEKGFTRTLSGRIRPIPELTSKNFMQKQFGERVAMNAPLQGTAADIIKVAMVRVHDRLIQEGFRSRLILQVHDELLIETEESERDAVQALLEEEMRGAASLDVELAVGTACGYNWYDAH